MSNQCDGCNLNDPVNKDGNHTDPKGYPYMACQSYRYKKRKDILAQLKKNREKGFCLVTKRRD